MLATFILASLLSLGSCSTCSVTGRDVKLCDPHASEERAALARAGSRLGSKDEAERRAALDALAALTEGHANAPSPRIAESLASALDDDSFEVRAHAAGLLGPPQHALVGLDALGQALAATKKEQAKLNAEYDGLSSKLEGKLPDKRRAELVEGRKNCNERRMALGQWRRTLVNQLAKFPDDRAVDAILAHTHRNLLGGNEEVLVRLGTRKAVLRLLESFDACDRDIANAERDAGANGKADSKPRTLGDMLAFKVVADMITSSTTARQTLAASFAERGLKPPEAAADTNAWKTWISQNIGAFPEHLPGITSPAW